MIYSELVKKACLISFEAHKNQLDKGGYPYVYHPFYLASQMDDEESTCVALLHDVIEDSTKYSVEFLKKEFNERIVNAVMLLTHKEQEYMEYIKAIKCNELARKVKICDLKHNLQNERTGCVSSKKEELYKKALDELTKPTFK